MAIRCHWPPESSAPPNSGREASRISPDTDRSSCTPLQQETQPVPSPPHPDILAPSNKYCHPVASGISGNSGRLQTEDKTVPFPQNPPRGRLIQSQNKLYEGSFSSSVFTNDRNRLPFRIRTDILSRDGRSALG